MQNTTFGVRGIVSRDAENGLGGNLPEDVAVAEGQRAGRRGFRCDGLQRAFREIETNLLETSGDMAEPLLQQNAASPSNTHILSVQTRIPSRPSSSVSSTRCIQGSGGRFLLHPGTSVRMGLDYERVEQRR